MKNRFSILFLFSLSTLNLASLNADYQVSGELKQWHKVTITFDGPDSSESGRPNPFYDYRLDVTFTQGDRVFRIPGYYAADGNAAESSATKGNKWRVHFMPESMGEWEFKASFRWGEGIAVSDLPNAGQGVSFDGTAGRFSVGPSDKPDPDMRSKGRLDYVGKRYLQFRGNQDTVVRSPTSALLRHAIFQHRDPRTK